MPLVVTKEPIIYRNFIAGAGNRAIGVGYPGGINLAWSAEDMNLALVWRGAFIDAARHWNGRGGGAQPPLGYDVFHPTEEATPPLAVPASPGEAWPKRGKDERATDFQWKGYALDAQRVPTFFYEWKGIKVAERFEATGDAVAGTGKLVRNLTLTGTIPPGALLRVAEGTSIQPKGDAFLVDGPSKFLVSASGAQITGKDLLVPAQATIQVTYSWPGLLDHAAAQ
jgi:hypothetical protein